MKRQYVGWLHGFQYVENMTGAMMLHESPADRMWEEGLVVLAVCCTVLYLFLIAASLACCGVGNKWMATYQFGSTRWLVGFGAFLFGLAVGTTCVLFAASATLTAVRI